MHKAKEYMLSVVLGLVTGILGVYLMGYLAAIAIPKFVFDWLDKNLSILIGMVALDIFFQFVAVGIFGIISGILIGKYRKTDWRINTLAYYFSYIFYVTVGVPLMYGLHIELPVPFSYLKQTLGLPLLVLPLCVFIAAYVANSRMARL